MVCHQQSLKVAITRGASGVIGEGKVGGPGGRVPPDIFHRKIFADLSGKILKRKKKGKWRVKEGKFEREEVEKLKMEGE